MLRPLQPPFLDFLSDFLYFRYPLILSFIILSSFVTPHIRRSIRISAISNLFSCACSSLCPVHKCRSSTFIFLVGLYSSRRYRPLSRRLDRCDRVIQKESGDPNGGNMCSFSGATGTPRVRHNAHYVPYAQIRFDL